MDREVVVKEVRKKRIADRVVKVTGESALVERNGKGGLERVTVPD